MTVKLTSLERLARVEEQTENIEKKVDTIDHKLDKLIDSLDNRYSSKWVENAMKTIITTVCLGVLGALIALVLHKG